MSSRRFHLTLLGIFVASLALAGSLFGQAGLRESLERLDRNENGYLDPDEVTPLARPFLERILGERGGRRRDVDFNERIPISRIQESARYYFAVRNGVQGSEVRPERESSLKDFELSREDRIVPDFGIAEVKFPFIRADLDEADQTLRRCDRNRDGFIDREEAARNEWTHRDPFDDDTNGDDKLSRLELAQRYARRRLLSDDAGELWKKQRRTGSEVKPSVNRSEENRRGWDREPAARLANDILRRFDTDQDRALDQTEIQQIGIPLARMDMNQDNRVTRDEIEEFVGVMQSELPRTIEGVPTWFVELDVNRNEQIEMVEYSEDWTDAKLREFSELDLNSDGVITTEEVIQATSSTGAQYVSSQAEIIPPGKTIISEIEIDDSFRIADLKLTLSLTHTYASHLDAYLLGPDGQRIELFTEVGGSDDNFINTIFDDAAGTPISKARPPFTGSFRPEAIDKRQESLGRYRGKSPRGVWQLMVRNSRGDRFGMLHQWGLKITPEDR